MTNLLHIDSSARSGCSNNHPYGSHTRRLTARFIEKWKSYQSDTSIVYRDVGVQPPKPVTGEWIHAAFTPNAKREAWMHEVLAESDTLIDELLVADIIVVGVPMYNFGPPAQFKAYIDNIVRVGRTFGFDRQRKGDPYWPLLQDDQKRLVILSSRGDYGYADGERMASKNHVESSVKTAFGYLGITDVREIAIEYDEFSDQRLQDSILEAECRVDQLVQKLIQSPENNLNYLNL